MMPTREALATAMLLMPVACSYAPSPHAASPPAATTPETPQPVAVTPQPPKPVIPNPPSDDEVFASLFLSHEQVGPSKQLVEELNLSRGTTFRAAEGIRARSVRWVEGSTNEVVHTITDTRWTFSDESHARSFFAQWTTNDLEADVPIDAIAPVGDESRTFSCPRAESSGPMQDMYVFVLRVEDVVAGVTVVRGRKSPKGSLTPERALGFARLAEQRIAAALAARESR